MTPEATLAPDDVLVIGAGPAGIASAYALQRMGISYRVVDRAEVIASTWDRLYPSLRLNTTRFYSHMRGMRFPWRYGLFPSGRQYHDYLRRYVAKYRLKIELGIAVERVVPQANLWRVETSAGTWLYRAVIVATGIFGRPIKPHLVGEETFSGEIIHASEFRAWEQVRDKRVMVMGNGPSGVDIAVASGQVAMRTYLLMRSGIDLRPRYPYGLPKHGWMMLGSLMPRRWCDRLLRWVDGAKLNQERYGLKRPVKGTSSAVPYRGEELIQAVRRGYVEPIYGTISHVAGNGIYLYEGECLEVDVLVMATGYEPVLGEILDIALPMSEVMADKGDSCEFEFGPNGERGWVLRDVSEHRNGRQILGYEGLYVVGTFYKGKGAMYNFNREAQVAAEQINQYLLK